MSNTEYLVELIEERTESSQTFKYVDEEDRYVLKSYNTPNFYKGNNDEWVEFEDDIGDRSNIVRQRYTAKILNDNIGYEGETSNGKKIGLKLNCDYVEPKIIGNEVIYENVSKDVDFVLTFERDQIQAKSVLKSMLASNECSYRVNIDDEDIDSLINVGWDNKNRQAKIKVTTEKIDDGVYDVYQIFENEVLQIDPKTRVRSWEKDISYPVTIDPTISMAPIKSLNTLINKWQKGNVGKPGVNTFDELQGSSFYTCFSWNSYFTQCYFGSTLFNTTGHPYTRFSTFNRNVDPTVNVSTQPNSGGNTAASWYPCHIPPGSIIKSANLTIDYKKTAGSKTVQLGLGKKDNGFGNAPGWDVIAAWDSFASPPNNTLYRGTGWANEAENMTTGQIITTASLGTAPVTTPTQLGSYDITSIVQSRIDTFDYSKPLAGNNADTRKLYILMNATVAGTVNEKVTFGNNVGGFDNILTIDYTLPRKKQAGFFI